MTAKHGVREFASRDCREWVLAVDPGTATGFSVGNPENGELILCGQQPPHTFELWAEWYASQMGGRLTIVCERFTISQRTLKSSRDGSYDALYIIGTLQFLCRKYTERELHFQQPVEAMNLITDDRLKAMGWYQKSFGHANDALRHLAFYLAQQGAIKLPVL